MLVKCQKCGAPFKTYPSTIKAGRGKFCGRSCMKGCSARHGESKTALYVAWCDMKRRCTPKSRVAMYYANRGITVCDAWSESYEAFRDWALANGYKQGLELDRRDNDKGYSPDNCRWATRGQQMANIGKRRDAKTSKYKGVSWHAGSSKWRAQIGHMGKTLHIGQFDSEAEAARAYDRKSRELFGEFANPNFRKGGVSF